MARSNSRNHSVSRAYAFETPRRRALDALSCNVDTPARSLMARGGGSGSPQNLIGQQRCECLGQGRRIIAVEHLVTGQEVTA